MLSLPDVITCFFFEFLGEGFEAIAKQKNETGGR